MVQFAGPGPWQRITHAEEVWGTVVTFDARAEQLPTDTVEIFQDGIALLHQIDTWFSTYRADSSITALRNQLVDFQQLPSVVQVVLNNCAFAREVTEGAFDPWSVRDGVDPSGYVKGWAADVIARLFVERGLVNICVNAAGDIACRGNQAPGEPWRMGIVNPYDLGAVIAYTDVVDGALATSGFYERGSHIENIHETAQKWDAASVAGPDAGLADAYATALLVVGKAGFRWFENQPEWSALLVEKERIHMCGSAFQAE
jgi:thiamine biosynthesis lipoprotein